MTAERLGTIDSLCNAFTPDRQAVWDGAIAATGVAVKVRRDDTDGFAAPDVMAACVSVAIFITSSGMLV